MTRDDERTPEQRVTHRWGVVAGWAALCRANHNDAEIVMICRALCAGQTATFGGGDTLTARITREV